MLATPLRTPRRKNSPLANNLSTPLLVPPSPQLQQLGYGTGWLFILVNNVRIGTFSKIN